MKGFDRSQICLTEVRIEDFNGFLFANLDPDAAPMDDWYPGVRGEIREYVPEVDGLAPLEWFEIPERCNWKVSIENYSECYHCAINHRTFSEGVVRPETYDISPMEGGYVLRHTTECQNLEAMTYPVDLSVPHAGEYRSWFLWPMTSFQCYPGNVLNTYHWRSRGVDECTVYRGWYTQGGAECEVVRALARQDRETTVEEDIHLVESVHRGLKSRGYRPGPLVVDPACGVKLRAFDPGAPALDARGGGAVSAAPAGGGGMLMPQAWREEHKLFAHQVGFTSPPFDYDAAPSDFLRMCPETVGVHGWMLHVPDYAHGIDDRRRSFGMLDDFAHCMSRNGADVAAQVGSNWVHACGLGVEGVRRHCEEIGERHGLAFHMAGYAMVEALRAMSVEKVALNAAYHWPEWWQGTVGFLREAGFDIVWAGNFHDQGWFASQEEINDRRWVFRRRPRREVVPAGGRTRPECRRLSDQRNVQLPHRAGRPAAAPRASRPRTRGQARQARDRPRHRPLLADLQVARHRARHAAGRAAGESPWIGYSRCGRFPARPRPPSRR